MENRIHRFKFTERVPIADVEQTLHLAVLAAESMYGRPRVRLNASFFLDKGKRSCVIDTANEVGRDVSRIFTGFLTHEFGDGAFEINRIETQEVKP